MRYAAQRYGSWDWLNLDAPLVTDGPEFALSSWGVMRATITPELGQGIAEDGRPVFEEWGTLIHVETPGDTDRRRWTGIVARSELKGAEWVLRVVEFPGYASGIPIDALIRGTGTDPAELIRQIWQSVQAHPNSWLNVDVVGETPVRLGTDLDDAVAAARAAMDARRQTLDGLQDTRATAAATLQNDAYTLADEVAAARSQLTAAQATLAGLLAAGATAAQVADARDVVASRQGTLTGLETAYRTETGAGRAALAAAAGNVEQARELYDQARDAYQAAVDKARTEGGAYEIRPEDLTDAARAISDVVRSSGVEWTTGVEYSETVPQCFIRVHYPRAGTTRDDLKFEQGVNVISELVAVRDGDDYANAGHGIGAGEGSAAIRATVENPSPRLRRPTVFEDRSLKTAAQLTAALRAQVAALDGEPYVQAITVIDHENAPVGSWSVGDVIRIEGHVPHLGRYSKRHRVISWKYLGPDRAEIQLEPAR